MAYEYFSQTSPSLPPDGAEVETVIFLITLEFVGAKTTEALATGRAPIAAGLIGSFPPIPCCTAWIREAAPIVVASNCGVPKDSH